MANYTGYGALAGTWTWSPQAVLYVSPTIVVLGGLDGTYTSFEGSGFTYNGTSFTGGTITSMRRWNSSDVVVEEVTGLSFSMTTLMSLTTYTGRFGNLFDGNDTFSVTGTALSLSNLGFGTVNGFGGTNAINQTGMTSAQQSFYFNGTNSYFMADIPGGGGHWFSNISSFTGGNGNDRFIFQNTSGIYGTTIDGGVGGGEIHMALSGVGSEYVLSMGSMTIRNIASISFANPAGYASSIAWILVDASQFSANGLPTNLQIKGNTTGAADTFIIQTGTSFDASGLTFDTAFTSDPANGVSISAYSNSGVNITGITTNAILTEAIYGGHGNDTLSAGNVTFGVEIVGNDGHDSITGAAGNDILQGGVGNDTLNGAGGSDYADYFGSTGTVIVRLDTNQVDASGAALGFDTLVSIENARSGSGNDQMWGNDLTNTLDGNGGNDSINGLGGNDSLVGQEGNDTLAGGLGMDLMFAGEGDDVFVATHDDGNDSMLGGNGFDILDYSGVNGVVQVNQLLGSTTGSAGNDTLFDVIEQIKGTAFNDVLSGGHGINVLDGEGGNDQFFGNNGDDLMRGGTGDDTFYFSTSDGNDTLLGGDGFDILDYSTLGGVVQVNQLAGTTTGTANNDTLSDVFEMVIGTAFGDVLSGGHGINSLKGNGGGDQIFANNGDDYMSGGTGNDTMTGGVGNDTQDVRNGEGVDTWLDFTAGGTDDTITLTYYSGLGVSNFSQLQASGRLSTVSGHAELALNGGDRIIFNNVASHLSLTAADFIF